MIAGIILAAGKGTRIKSLAGEKKKNKVTLPFLNKPLIIYAVELMKELAWPVVVVIGAFHQSVKEVLRDYDVVYAYQKKRLGTAHAVKVGIKALSDFSSLKMVLVGYGDHSMFYKKETVKKLIDFHQKEEAVMSLISTEFENPEKLRWGRIIRDKQGNIIDSIEDKDASKEQKKIKELNAGFYCFDFRFLNENIGKIKKSPITKEYYLNNLIKIAADSGKKVIGLKIPFSGVGIGINTYQELEESQRLYLKKSK